MKTWHLRVRYDAAGDRLVYDRTLHPGPGKSLYGLEVAKAMALPTEVLEAAHQIRRELLGSATEEAAPESSWNTAVQRRACELCSCEIVRDLEVHHIRPRCEAGEGDVKQINALRNLIVVCQKCHDDHHAGKMEIGPLKQTSDGPVREVVRLEDYAYRPAPVTPKGVTAGSGLTEAQIATVESYLRKYPNCTPKRLLFDLEEKEGIRLTAQRLRTIRTAMPA
jgi:cytochrome c2